MQRFFYFTHKQQRPYVFGPPSIYLTILILLSGCGSFGPATAAPTATATRAYALVPTFTPTPETAAPAAALTPTDTATAVVVAVAPASAPLTPTVAVTPTSMIIIPTNTPATEARLTITADAVNIRSGPATTFALVGSAVNGESFPIEARNAAGDWWQICCINGKPGWVWGNWQPWKMPHTWLLPLIFLPLSNQPQPPSPKRRPPSPSRRPVRRRPRRRPRLPLIPVPVILALTPNIRLCILKF
ncbi:MAG: SH3 domain-containing protein [Caldilineaceae bacterium]